MSNVAIVLIASMLSGCVTYDRHVKLEPVAGAAAVSAPAGASLVLTVADCRAPDLKGVVGHTKNGLGMKIASVLSDDKDPKAWVTECVIADLDRVGFDMRASGDADLHVNLDLTICYAQAYMTYGGEVAADVTVARGSTVLLPKTHYSGKADYGMNWGATEASYQGVLHEAMRELLDAITPAIAAAVKAGPSS